MSTTPHTRQRDPPRTSNRRSDDRSRSPSVSRSHRSDRPADRLRERVGNRGLERAFAGRERDDGAGRDRAVERVADMLSVEAGRPLPPSTEREMAVRFGHDFGDVRVHDGPSAARTVRELGAAAYTVGSDVVLGEEVAPGSPGRELLLAHELAHVVQNDRGGARAEPSRLVSRRGDRAETDAERAAVDAAVGRRATVGAISGAVVSRGVLDWIEEKASNAGSAIGGFASDVGSSISGAASDAWDVAKGVGSEVADRYERHGLFGMVYEGMKENAGYVRQGGEWLEGKIDWAQDEAAEFVHGLAGRAKGTPILGDLAAFGARGFDWGTQLTAGVLQGATSFGSGLLGMAANPVDTVRGLATMAEHVPMIPGVPNPIKLARGAYDVLVEGADVGEVADRALNPVRSIRDDAAFFGRMGRALIEPYRRSIGEDGDYAQAVGRGIFDIGSVLLGGGAGAADDVARIGVGAADDVARVGLGTADEVADATRLLDEAAGAGVTSATDDARRLTASVADDAASTWITHGGKKIRWTPDGWKDEAGRFAKGPYPATSGAGTGSSRSSFLRRLKQQSLEDPNKLPRHIVGWLKNQRRQKGSGYLKNPPGYEGGHPASMPYATHGNQGRGVWEFAADNQARAPIAKLQKRLATDPNYTVADLIRDAREIYRKRRNDPNWRPNLP